MLTLGLQTGHRQSRDFPSLFSRRLALHTILTNLEVGLSSTFCPPVPTCRSSFHCYPPSKQTETNNKGKQSYKGSAIASCGPHLLKDKNHMGTLPWQCIQHLGAAGTVVPSAGRAQVHTQRTDAGLASLSGYQQTPRAGIQDDLLRPPSQHKSTILYLTGEEPRLDDIASVGGWGVGGPPIPCPS